MRPPRIETPAAKRLLNLRILSRGIRVRCGDAATQRLVLAAYGEMLGDAGEVALDYAVGRGRASEGYYVARQGQRPLVVRDEGTFLAAFDRDISIELQKMRRDLYFVHAAVLIRRAAVMLVAKPGGGKSTLTWAMLHHGFGFLSDELAPVDLDTLQVHPYPRRLALKRKPPDSYPLPRRTVVTSRSLHVQDVPGRVGKAPAQLEAVVFVHYDPGASRPAIRQLTTAEAGAHLYANVLNALAHASDGLDGAVRITSACPCYELVSADLPATASLLAETLESRHQI